MKQKIAKMVLAVTLCTAMLGTTAMAASQDLTATTGGSITGDSTVVNPSYKVVVPTTLVFGIDPFQQKGQSQIYSEDFYVINKSNVPVQLDCAVTLTAGTDVVIKDAEADVTETNADKLVYMAAEIAGDVTETSAAAAAYSTALKKDGDDVYEATVAPGGSALEDMIDVTSVAGAYTTSKKVPLKADATGTKLTFALNKAEYQTYYTVADKSASASQYKAMAADKGGSASFRFSGKVNTKATWAASAVTATVAYTFNGLTPENYTALTTTPAANAHAYVEVNQNVLVSDGTNDIVIYYTGNKPANVVIAPITTTGSATSAMTKTEKANEVEMTNEKVTLKAAFLKSIISNTQRGAGTYKVTINSTDYTITLS